MIVAACAVAHGNLSVTISTTPVVSQPNALAAGQTVSRDKADITITQQAGSLIQMPAGTQLAKCVMTQAEDMSSKGDISNINLRLQVRMPDAGGNCTSSGALVATLQDTSYDSKSMVAFESSVATLASIESTLITRPLGSATQRAARVS